MGKSDTISDPVERIVAKTLEMLGIEYVHNAANMALRNSTIDFYLPDFALYIECKQFATERTYIQTKDLTNIIIVQGTTAANQLSHLLLQLAALKTTEPSVPS